MTSFFADMGINPFLLTGLVAGALAGATCGTIGPYVVTRQLVFLAGALAHVAVGGVGAAIWLAHRWPATFGGLEPIHGAAIVAVATAPLLAWIRHRVGERLDTAVGALWAAGMAVGILLIKLTPGYHTELMSYLFGNLVYVTWADTRFLALLGGTVAITVVLWHRRFVALCLDGPYAALRGVSVVRTDALLLVLVALSVVALTRIVGLILVLALLTLPAATAGRLVRRLAPMVLVSAVLATLLTTVPRIAVYGSQVSPEAAIVLASVATWAAVAGGAAILSARRERKFE